VDLTVVIALYIVGALVAMYLAQLRGYWWPIGLVFGAIVGPFAPVVMIVLPNRKRRRAESRR